MIKIAHNYNTVNVFTCIVEMEALDQYKVYHLKKRTIAHVTNYKLKY